MQNNCTPLISEMMHTREGQPGHRISENTGAHHDKNDQNKRQYAEKHPHDGGYAQGHGGKGGNSLQGVDQQFPEIPFGLTLGPLYILIFQPLGPKAHPAVDPLGKAVVFLHLQDGIHHRRVISL